MNITKTTTFNYCFIFNHSIFIYILFNFLCKKLFLFFFLFTFFDKKTLLLLFLSYRKACSDGACSPSGVFPSSSWAFSLKGSPRRSVPFRLSRSHRSGLSFLLRFHFITLFYFLSYFNTILFSLKNFVLKKKK